ncbi:MAG: hypothetical protein ACFBSF_05995 [Leptolyngbyaceae cyanobacterium]
MKSSYLDDVALIELFIKGQAHLAANEKLQVQSTLDVEQLLSRKGQVLAIAHLKASPPEIRVRCQSTYTELLDKTLRSQGFLPPSPDDTAGFICYERYKGPEGYQLHCEPARLLWREWWIRYRQNRPQFLDMELLLFTHNQWYPIRNIVFSNGTLFVTTYRGETAHQGDDLVIWAENKALPARRSRFISGRGTPRQQPTAAHQTSTDKPLAAPRSQTSAPGTLKPLPSQSAIASASSAVVNRGNCSVPQAWRTVARCEAGKIYIKTAIGELVVEGANLRCQLRK